MDTKTTDYAQFLRIFTPDNNNTENIRAVIKNIGQQDSDIREKGWNEDYDNMTSTYDHLISLMRDPENGILKKIGKALWYNSIRDISNYIVRIDNCPTNTNNFLKQMYVVLYNILELSTSSKTFIPVDNYVQKVQDICNIFNNTSRESVAEFDKMVSSLDKDIYPGDILLIKDTINKPKSKGDLGLETVDKPEGDSGLETVDKSKSKSGSKSESQQKLELITKTGKLKNILKSGFADCIIRLRYLQATDIIRNQRLEYNIGPQHEIFTCYDLECISAGVNLNTDEFKDNDLTGVDFSDEIYSGDAPVSKIIKNIGDGLDNTKYGLLSSNDVSALLVSLKKVYMRASYLQLIQTLSSLAERKSYQRIKIRRDEVYNVIDEIRKLSFETHKQLLIEDNYINKLCVNIIKSVNPNIDEESIMENLVIDIGKFPDDTFQLINVK
jgi:hypothetical protein